MANITRFNSKSLIENRHIRIFLSSTFNDMVEERTALVKTFNVLRMEAAKRNVTLTVVDLRWGITDKDARDGKVISICLEEIEHSHPFFIGILGNEYGSCPERSVLEKNPELIERYPWLEKAIAYNNVDSMSITEMEIRYGVLDRENTVDAAFFFKNTDKCDKSGRLNKLKNDIRERYIPKEYDEVAQLCNYVSIEVRNLINKYFPESDSCSLLQLERMSHKAYIRSNHSVYLPREHYYKEIDDFVLSDLQYLVFTGDSGLGKSALLANWILKNEAKSEYNLIYHFVENSFTDNGYDKILRHICDEINDLYHIKYDLSGEGNIECEASYLFDKLIFQNKELVIVLDGINRIDHLQNEKLLLWLPKANKRVKFIISTLCEDETYNIITRREKCKVEKVKPLTAEETKKFIPNYLIRYGKTLDENLVECISQCSMCNNPLVLRTLLDGLISFGSHWELGHRVKYYLSACPERYVLKQNFETLKKEISLYREVVSDKPIEIYSPIYKLINNKFFNHVLTLLEQDYSADQDLVRHALTLIYISEHGLSEHEIISILKCNPIDWSWFYAAFYNNFHIRNGLISIANQYVIDVIKERYNIICRDLDNEDVQKVILCRREIIEYCISNNSFRDIRECAFQFYKLEEWDNLFETLSPINIFISFVKSDFKTLKKYWQALKENDYSINVYLSQIENLSDDLKLKVLCMLSRFACEHVLDKYVAEYCTGTLLKLISGLRGYTGTDYMEALILRGDYSLKWEDHNSIVDNYELALFYYKRALTIAADHGVNDLNIRSRLLDTKMEKILSGRSEDVNQVLQEVDQLCIVSAHTYGSNSYMYATFLTKRGLFARKVKKYDIATKDLLDAHKIYANTRGENSVDYATSLSNIGLLYSDQPKNIEKAFKCLRLAQEVIYNIFGDVKNDHADNIIDNLSYAYLKQGEYTNNCNCFEEAFKYKQILLEHYLDKYGDSHPLVAECYWYMSFLKEYTGDLELAYEYAYKDFKITRSNDSFNRLERLYFLLNGRDK